MTYSKIKILVFCFVTFTFLSTNTRKEEYNSSHKEFYSTGELKYICYDHHKKAGGEGTGMYQRIKFKRIYYDKCGNPKLTIKGIHEIGCWRNNLTISTFQKENETLVCNKETFTYLSREELVEELKKEY